MAVKIIKASLRPDIVNLFSIQNIEPVADFDILVTSGTELNGVSSQRREKHKT